MPTHEDEYSVEEMHDVVLGKQTAAQEFNAWWACASGFAVGAGSMLYFYGYRKQPMIGLAIPIAYAVGFSFVRPTKSGIAKRHPEYKNNEYLCFGYQNKGRKKVVTNTLIGTLSGILVGALTSLAFPSEPTVKPASK
ncbi:MAG: hypothetical protein HUK15_06570, partial [Bacteroidales bacterium]|nr:hypothetical protein [Bacteroidales bacterium]